MFIQVVEWLIKLAGLLDDASKLSKARNRKKLAATLVQLYTLLSRIADNAERIHSELRSMHRYIEEPDRMYFDSLGMLLGDQRQLLKELQDLVRDNNELINVYGDKVADEIAYITGLKVSLIDIITTFALYQADNFWWGRNRDANWIPLSLDLMDVPAFKELCEKQAERYRLSDSQDAEDEARVWRRFRSDFRELLLRPDERVHALFAIKAGKNKEQDAEIVSRLLKQTETLESPRKLREARNIIGGILRQHFTIEEVF
jgi:hypothetical protein